MNSRPISHSFLPLLRVISVCLSLLSATAIAQTATLRFAPAVTISVPALAVLAGDLNGDGKADLIGLGDSQIFVALGHGDGTFGSPVTYALPNMGNRVVHYISVDDFNNDSKPDVVVITYPGEDSSGAPAANGYMFLGNGDGTLKTPLTFPTGNDAWSIAVGDINRDNKLDMVVGGSTPTILLGNGDGTFQSAVPINVLQGTPDMVALGDMNHDGKLDLVVANNAAGVISVMLGNGDGTFQTPITTTFGFGEVFNHLTLADLNNDGKLDVVTALAQGTQVAVFLGKGDGTLVNAVTYNAGDEPFGLVTADFNGDGKLDLAAADGNFSQVTSNFMGLTILLGNGDGTLPTQVSKQLLPNQAVYWIDTADFNGDGLPDIVAANGTGISVLINAPNSAPLPLALLNPLQLSFTATAVGSSSATQAVSLINRGDAPMSISGFSISPDFAQTNNCPAQLAVATLCTITVSFTPQAGGSRTGTLAISQNSATNPVSVGLSGNALDFGLTAAAGAQTTATVQSGGTATYNLTVSPTGPLAGSAALSCTGAPQNASCSVSPAQVDLSSGTAQAFTVSVNTKATTQGALRPSMFRSQILFAVLLLPPAGLLWLRSRKTPLSRSTRTLSALFFCCLALCLISAACGGGGNSSSSTSSTSTSTPTPTVSTTTPPGTYSLTVTAKQGSVIRTIPLTLVVK